MTFYFHVVQLDDGRWACQHGRCVYDQHTNLEDAREHIRVLASGQRPASIFVHHRDGRVECVETL